MTGAREEVIARLKWFALTGDTKCWAGPETTVDGLRENMRADVQAVLEFLGEMVQP